MPELDDYPLVDKLALIGGCVRLPVPLDRERLVDEVLALPESLWGSRGGRVGVHQPTEGIFLRGHAPIEGPRPIEDREPLALLPCIRTLIQATIPAPPMRCLLAKLAPGSVIKMHVDKGDYFQRTLRLHVPIVTDPAVEMISNDRCYTMQVGEVWALNNSTFHGVRSRWTRPRIHLICDFLPTEALCALIRSGEHDLGRRDDEALREVMVGMAS
jgi:hypothetical protein